MKKTILIGGLAVIAIILVLLFVGGGNGDVDNDDTTDRDQEILGEEVTHPDVRVDTPEAGDTISNPVLLRGEARGTWYFEASFSARIEANDGRVLAHVPVQADGEWMTEDFVPFEQEISWSGETPEAGYVVLEKANPSGLPENAAEVRIPVYFEGAGETQQTVSVYFGRDVVGTDALNCEAVFEVTRIIEPTQAVARAAITELLEGPTNEEAQNRYITNIPDGVELNSIRIEDGTAYVDFSTELNQGGGSCHVQAARAQIESTLTQFSTVDDVVISVEGDTEDVLQP